MTLGVSPKVLIPGIVQLIVGIALVVVGASNGDEGLRSSGEGVVAAALATFGIGYHASPGDVTTTIGVASDELNAGKLDAPIPPEEGSQ